MIAGVKIENYPHTGLTVNCSQLTFLAFSAKFDVT